MARMVHLLDVRKKRKLKVNVYKVVSRAVEEGVAYGINRAFKYTDIPSRDTIVENVEREVMNSLADVINYGH